MNIELLTKNDLDVYHEKLINEIKQLITNSGNTKEWLRTAEVKKILKISSGTLQTLRMKGVIPHKKVNGMLFYNRQSIDKILEL